MQGKKYRRGYERAIVCAIAKRTCGRPRLRRSYPLVLAELATRTGAGCETWFADGHCGAAECGSSAYRRGSGTGGGPLEPLEAQPLVDTCPGPGGPRRRRSVAVAAIHSFLQSPSLASHLHLPLPRPRPRCSVSFPSLHVCPPRVAASLTHDARYSTAPDSTTLQGHIPSPYPHLTPTVGCPIRLCSSLSLSSPPDLFVRPALRDPWEARSLLLLSHRPRPR